MSLVERTVPSTGDKQDYVVSAETDTENGTLPGWDEMYI